MSAVPTFEQDVYIQRTYDQAKNGFAVQLMGRVKWTTLRGGFYFSNGGYASKALAFEAALAKIQQLHGGIGAGVRRSGMRTYRVVGAVKILAHIVGVTKVTDPAVRVDRWYWYDRRSGTVVSVPTSRGRYWLYVRKPGGKKWSKVGDPSSGGYFAADVRDQTQAHSAVTLVRDRWIAKGYDTKLDLQYWEPRS